MKKVKLSGKLGKGKYAIVDNEDFKRVCRHKWHLSNFGYAIHSVWDGKCVKKVMLHRFIMRVNGKRRLDHKNRDKLDNRKSNLRFANRSQNNANKEKMKNNKSGFKGVYLHKRWKTSPRWIAQVTTNNKVTYLGNFLTPEEAALAYDEGARKYFGEFAKTNY